jgi:putative NIF3 family GTP cyclohydrolase 1 type 2
MVDVLWMANRDEILGYCDDLLDSGSFDDYGPNGLQVPGRTGVSKVATGVSANLETLERAIGAGADLVITHHGLLWGDQLSVLSVPMAARLRALLCADLSLAAYHLPLDAHPEIGNNALLRDELDLEADERPFGQAKGSAIGLIGRTSEPIDLDELRRRLTEAVGREPLVFDAGPERISTVGIVTGSGGFALHEAGLRDRDVRDPPARRAGRPALLDRAPVHRRPQPDLAGRLWPRSEGEAGRKPRNFRKKD